MAVLPGIQSIPLQTPDPDRPIASYQPGILQQAQEQQGEAVSRVGAEATQTGDQIFQAQTQLQIGHAEQSFVAAKLAADQAASADPDYVNAPAKYAAALQSAAAQGAAGITSPAARTQFQDRIAFMQSYGVDGVLREARQKAQVSDHAFIQSTIDQASNAFAASGGGPDGALAVQSAGRTIAAMQAKGSITPDEATEYNLRLSQNAATARGRAFVAANPSAAATILAPTGTAADGSPIFSPRSAGDPNASWADHIPPAQRAELFAQAQGAQKAALGNELRQFELQRDLDAQKADQAASGYSKQLVIDPTKVDPVAIMNDPNFPASQWRLRASLAEAAGKAQDDYLSKTTRAYGPGFYAAYQAVHAPDGDPTRITDPQQLYARAGPGGDLSIAGVDKLRSDLAARGTPGAVAASKIQAGVMAYAKQELSFADDYPGLRDPKGEASFNIGFTPAFFKYWNDGIKAGKTPAELADKAAIDKLIAPFKRTTAQWVQDRLASDEPAMPGAAPAAVAQPGFDTVPPALNTRVPGQTAVTTPRGKFMWQADGWHPIPSAQPQAAPGP